MTIDASARRLGEIAWFERRLFTLMGEWTTSVPEPSVKLALARQSRHHGAHAVAVAALLPETRDHDPESLVRPGAPDRSAMFEAAASCETTGDRLDALIGDLVPHELTLLEAFLVEASAVRDAPATRTLVVVLAEARADLAELAGLL